MKGLFSTREAAKKLGVNLVTLQRHIAAQTIRVPPLQRVGGVKVRLWSHRDIENARTILADIKPGRKPKKKK
jgi:predicted site-specific integrase-resolvase